MRRLIPILIITLLAFGFFPVRLAYTEAEKAPNPTIAEEVAALREEVANLRKDNNTSKNWMAIQSIATLLVVIVAIIPLTRDILRRREMASNLRQRILTQFVLVLPSVKKRTEMTLWTNKPARLDSEEQKPVTALESLFPQAHILSAREHDILGAIILNLSAMTSPHVSEISPNQASNILVLIDEGIRKFEESKFLRGKRIDLPWSRSGEDLASQPHDEPPPEESA